MSYSDLQPPQAVASITPRIPVPTPTVLADEASGHGNPRPYVRFYTAAPVDGVAPVDGWTLCRFDDLDSDGFWTTEYVARSDATDVHLDVCRFRFTPSQARFDWLVRHDFPARPNPFGGWDDGDIEGRIAAEAGQWA